MSKAPNTPPEQLLNVKPLQIIDHPRPTGRPKKVVVRPLNLPMTDDERARYTAFQDYIIEENPDLTASDKMLLELAAIELIKYLRLVQWELENNTSVTMSRQHPGVQMRALLDQMSVTRKSRQQSGRKGEDPEAEKDRALLRALSS